MSKIKSTDTTEIKVNGLTPDESTGSALDTAMEMAPAEESAKAYKVKIEGTAFRQLSKRELFYATYEVRAHMSDSKDKEVTLTHWVGGAGDSAIRHAKDWSGNVARKNIGQIDSEGYVLMEVGYVDLSDMSVVKWSTLPEEKAPKAEKTARVSSAKTEAMESEIAVLTARIVMLEQAMSQAMDVIAVLQAQSVAVS